MASFVCHKMCYSRPNLRGAYVKGNLRGKNWTAYERRMFFTAPGESHAVSNIAYPIRYDSKLSGVRLRPPPIFLLLYNYLTKSSIFIKCRGIHFKLHMACINN